MSSLSLDLVDIVHGHCPVCLDTLDFVQGVHGQCPDCPLSPWTVSTESMDNVHWIHGHCPVWLVSLDFVHGLTGRCPEYPWTLSRLSTESMVNVHWVHGQSPGSPLSPWTFYRHLWWCSHFFPLCVRDRMWNSIVSIPDYFCFMYFGKLERFFTITSEHGCFQRKTKHWKTSLFLC